MGEDIVPSYQTINNKAILSSNNNIRAISTGPTQTLRITCDRALLNHSHRN